MLFDSQTLALLGDVAQGGKGTLAVRGREHADFGGRRPFFIGGLSGQERGIECGVGQVPALRSGLLRERQRSDLAQQRPPHIASGRLTCQVCFPREDHAEQCIQRAYVVGFGSCALRCLLNNVVDIGRIDGRLGHDKLGQGGLGQRLEPHGERIEPRRRGHVFAFEVQRLAEQTQQILNRHQVPHLVLRDANQLRRPFV